MRKIEFTKDWIIANKIAIQCNSKKEADTICGIFGIVISNYYDTNCCFGVDSSKSNYCFYAHNAAISYGETVIKASEAIAEYEASKRKIIGYIYPFKTINGHKVQDRSIVKKTVDNYTLFLDEISTTYGFPAEIVEQWEPVYEEVKPCFGGYDDLFKYFKGVKITFEEGKPITVYDTNVLVGTGRTHFIVSKQDYDFSPEFEHKLKEMGINI